MSSVGPRRSVECRVLGVRVNTRCPGQQGCWPLQRTFRSTLGLIEYVTHECSDRLRSPCGIGVITPWCEACPLNKEPTPIHQRSFDHIESPRHALARTVPAGTADGDLRDMRAALRNLSWAARRAGACDACGCDSESTMVTKPCIHGHV